MAREACGRKGRLKWCGDRGRDDLATVAGRRAARCRRRRHRRLQHVPRQDDRRVLRVDAAAAGHGLDGRRRAGDLEARARGDRHRPRRPGRRSGGGDRRHHRGHPFPGQRPGEARPAPGADRRRHRARRPGGGAGGARPGEDPARPAARAARAGGDRDQRPRRGAGNRLERPEPGGEALGGDEPEEPGGAVRRHHRHPAGRRRAVRGAGDRLCDAAGPEQDAGRLLGSRAADPADRDGHAGDGLVRGRAASPFPARSRRSSRASTPTAGS